MKTLKNMLFLTPLILGAQLNAKIHEEISKYSNKNLQETLCKVLPAKKSPEDKSVMTRENCNQVFTFAQDAARIAYNVETFIDEDLNVVKQKGDLLLAMLNCLDKNKRKSDACKKFSWTCKDKDGKSASCSFSCGDACSENELLSLIFKTTKELLDPVIKNLLASGSTPGSYNNGALFNLVSLQVLPTSIGKPAGTPETLRDKLTKKVATFTNELNTYLDTFNALALVLAPKVYVESTPALTPEQKTEALKVPPVEIPAAAPAIDPAVEADLEGL